MSYIDKTRSNVILSQPTEYNVYRKLPSIVKSKPIQMLRVSEETLPNDIASVTAFADKAMKFVIRLSKEKYYLLAAGNQIFNIVLAQILQEHNVNFSVLYYHGESKSYKEVSLWG